MLSTSQNIYPTSSRRVSELLQIN